MSGSEDHRARASLRHALGQEPPVQGRSKRPAAQDAGRGGLLGFYLLEAFFRVSASVLRGKLYAFTGSSWTDEWSQYVPGRGIP